VDRRPSKQQMLEYRRLGGQSAELIHSRRVDIREDPPHVNSDSDC